MKRPQALLTCILLAAQATASAQNSPGISAKPADMTLQPEPHKVPIDLTQPDRPPLISDTRYEPPSDLLAAAGSNVVGMDGPALLSIAKQFMAERRVSEAWPIFEHLLKRDPGLFDLHYQAAVAAHMLGKKSKASSLAAEALARGEDSARLQVLLGVMAMRGKKYPEALAAFERASQLNPKDAVALYNQSETLREQGRPKEAVAVLQRAQKLDPKRKLLALKIRLAQLEARQNVEEIEAEAVKRQSDSPQTEDWLMTAAAIHLKKGNYSKAADAIRSAKVAAGVETIGPIFVEDPFFRKFAANEEMKDVRQELESK